MRTIALLIALSASAAIAQDQPTLDPTAPGVHVQTPWATVDAPAGAAVTVTHPYPVYVYRPGFFARCRMARAARRPAGYWQFVPYQPRVRVIVQ